MLRRNLRTLIGIVVVAAVAIYIAIPNSPGFHFSVFGITVNQDFPVHEGLDLQGGVEVLLAANMPAGQAVDPESMQAAIGIVTNRVNALGVSEPLVQAAQGNRIIVELPGIKDPQEAINTFGQTGLLEFVDAGSNYLPTGTVITTTLGGPSTAALPATTPGATGAVTNTVTSNASPFAGQTFTTVMQGKDLKSASVGFDNLGRPEIDFTLTPEGTKIFGDYTTKNVGKYLAIVMDKRVIECPVIQNAITSGSGVINGGSGPGFTLANAQSIVIQLKYGALPIPLKIVQIQTVGPTLGQDSVHRSIIAGIIGLAIVAAFMLVNYRLPGLLADLALIIYTAVAFALFKVIPITLTVAGIAGFILSIGMAVDANILIFERMKEELRAGRTFHSAVDHGFRRAWPSIRDSNMSTIITCAILYWFGTTFSASIIQGFAVTLFIGVVVSLASAVFVTQTFLQVSIDAGLASKPELYGMDTPKVPEGATS